METKSTPTVLIVIIAVVLVIFFLLRGNAFDLPSGETVRLADIEVTNNEDNVSNESEKNNIDEPATSTTSTFAFKSTRDIFVTDGVRHSIPLDEIRQGCFGRDCIPSVDNPVFVSIKDAERLFRTAGELEERVIGIGLSFGGENRFYPFNMLVTKEIVNDVVAGIPLVVTYCPLCGTGIVFDRTVNGEVFDFGVSGMLWQSNLLMYNRADEEEDISLWSQVLGEAVLGNNTGTKLAIIPSDVVTFADWKASNPKGEVLNAGRIGDPYNGDYYGVASRFNPTFDESTSPISPTAYVLGIEIDGKFKAYQRDSLSVGTTNDTFAGRDIRIEKEKDGVIRIFATGIKDTLPVVTGLWFSWSAAHAETELYK